MQWFWKGRVMSDSVDDDRMDDILSEALGPTQPQFDFQQWQREHTEAVETLRSWGNDAPESRARSAAEISIVSWVLRNRFKAAAVSAAAAALILVISYGVLDRDDRRLAAVDDIQAKTANGPDDKVLTSDQREQRGETLGPGKQQVKAPQPNQSEHVVTTEGNGWHETAKASVASSMGKKSVARRSSSHPSRDEERLPEVAAPLSAEDPAVRAPRVLHDYAYGATWLPFNREDIRTISIFNAIETASGKKLIGRVSPKHHGAVFACMAGSQPPEDDSGFDCEWTRETVIELKDGRSFVVNYHGECDAPEFRIQQRGTGRSSTRWSRHLKGLLRILESGKVRVRFVRLEKDQDGAFAVADSCVHTVSLGIPTSRPDDSGYRYAVHSKVEADGVIALQVEFRREVEEAGPPDVRSFAGTVRLSEEELSTKGHNQVLRSTGQSIVLMTVESHNH